MEIKKLFDEFPRNAISWRGQKVSENNGKYAAMAFAYINARDVMNRLDDVCGIENWQCRYSHADQKTICEIGVRINNEWLWKADGAGDTDVEAEKGSLSDAFKRAAVRWGIGRYLYNFETIWVPCEAYKDSNGKAKFRKFTEDPWKYVYKSVKSPFTNAALRNKFFENVIKSFDGAISLKELEEIRELNGDKLDEMKNGTEHDVLTYEEIVKQYKVFKKRFTDKAEMTASYGEGFANIPQEEPPQDRWEEESGFKRVKS